MGGMMGGGGAPSIPQRDLGSELSLIFGKGGFGREKKVFDNFWHDQPLLNESRDFALNNLENVDDLTDPLKKMFGALPGQFDNLSDRLGGMFKNLPNVNKLTAPLQHLLGSFGRVYDNQIAPVLNRGGALTGEQARNVDQATRAGFAARGNVMGNQALGTELLNRDEYRRGRFNEALGQGLGLSGEERNLTGGIEGLRTQDITNRLNITAGQGNLLGQEAGTANLLGSGIEGIQQGALNQALGTEQAATGSFASLINPLLAFGQDVASSNQNAEATQNIAGANKSSGAASGILSLVGSAAAAY